MKPSFVRNTFIFVLLFMPVAVYLVNPFDVATQSVRPRILGHDMYRIPSRSMQPTLIPGDIILASLISPKDSFPKKGQVVVFTHGDNNILFIKRVIALEGELVEIEAGIVKVNGVKLDESYINDENTSTAYSKTMRPIKIPKGKVFVLGDNRDNSNDSRNYGAILVSSVVAKAIRILYGKNNRSWENLNRNSKAEQ